MRAQNGKSNFVVVQVAIVESYQYPATAGFFLDRTVDKCQSFFKSYQRVIALQVGNLFVELVARRRENAGIVRVGFVVSDAVVRQDH